MVRCTNCEYSHETEPYSWVSRCEVHQLNLNGLEDRACNAYRAKKDDEQKAPDSQSLIAAACDEIKDMLLAKNRAYGNSALDPLRLFSKADRREQIRVRIDDKLSRIQRGEAAGEDAVKDLIGYLVLLRVAEKMETKEVADGQAKR